MGVTDTIDVQLAMSVFQITAVLFPLLLGLARYYVHQGDELSNIPGSTIIEYTSLLSSFLLLACISTLDVFLQYGNESIFLAVIAYVFFFIVLLLSIPAVIVDSSELSVFLPVAKGAVLALLVTVGASALLTVLI